MMNNFKTILATGAVLIAGFGQPLFGQATVVPFGGISQDTKLPVEIISDSFTMSQNEGKAEFVGNVVVGQGDMRLSAAKIIVEYAVQEDSDVDASAAGRIGRLIASGGVTLVSGSEAAEAQTAEYSIKNGTIVMKGDVILTQGGNALSGQTVTINLTDGSAQVEGRVKTIFQTGGSE
jgi:lipopolysaccharide export system protein LptA